MRQIPHGPEHLNCPFHRKPMSTVCHKCPLWVQVRGLNPQGGEVDQWDCTFTFLPMLLIENSQQQRHTGAAIESFRNAVLRVNAADHAREIPYAGNHRSAG